MASTKSNVCLKALGLVLGLLQLLCVLHAAHAAPVTLPPSERVTINLGAQPWRYYLGDPQSTPLPQDTTFDDSSWTTVGVPWSADQLYTFVNATAGGGDGNLAPSSVAWYRTPIVLGSQYAGRKVLVEFEGAHTGVQVYVNGTLLRGISSVANDSNASHVVGFIPFIVDLTPYLKIDGTTKNILAVRVARNASWFEDPNFAEGFRFGQSELGLFRPVDMFITDKVYIPENVYSNLKTWGTHISTISASDTSALVDVQTNVVNEGTTAQPVTLTTQIVDASGNVVATGQSTQTVATSAAPNLVPQLFDQQLTVNNPTLWYPNSSIYGKPYMYKVFHTVSINGAVIDAVQSPLGIRTITWDANFPYFNGKPQPQYLWGASGRYDYPALGSGVPEEQQWRDLQQLAAAGGNLWRPGHSSPSEEFINAADAYGVMIVDPSGEGEGAFSNPCSPSCDKGTLKNELHRDMIIRDRNHPSVVAWEASNGQIDNTFAVNLQSIVDTWDSSSPRKQAVRNTQPNAGNVPILGCTLAGCEVGTKTDTADGTENNPAWGAEYWNNGTARQAWDYELAFAAPFVDDLRKGREANTFGMAQWYFADSPGENNLFVEGVDHPNVRSLGASMVDMNRFPKMLYYIYEAAWTPYEDAAGGIHPVVHLAHHWTNRSGTVQVNAFSNCPYVRLLINGQPQGSDQVPNPWNSVDPTANSYPDGEDTAAHLQASAAIQQQTTQLPFQTHWNVTWTPGTETAECLDAYKNVIGTPDTKTSAGAPDHIVLTVVPELTKPDGTSFAITANGSDAAFVEARVVDANGVVVPTDNADKLTFSVSGPAMYMGGSEQYVSTGTDAFVSSPQNPNAGANAELSYHSPGDPELQVEGGMTKIAIRSRFTAGTVTVSATAPGLKAGTAAYTIQPAVATTSPVAAAPEIIVPPANTAVTAGQQALFSVTATGAAPLTFQWSKNGAAIAGATSSTYKTPATVTGDNGATFSVTVSNGQSPAATASAKLTVDAPAAPAITTQPVSQSAYVGQTATFTVAATGSPTLTYQWQKNGGVISGATGASYTTPVLAAGDNASTYNVVVTNPVNQVTSATATLTVKAAIAPVITAQPQSVAVLANQPATFSVTVTGTTPITYQWQKNSANITGANASTYTIAAVQPSDAASYTVIVTNAANSVTSAAARLTIAPPGPNLALSGAASASSVHDPVSTPAAFAFDGNLATRWDSVEGTSPTDKTPDPSWVQVDLGSQKSFNTVVLYWESAYATSYQILWSNDNTTWTQAYATTSGGGGTETVTFPMVSARYVRMNGRVRATIYGYSLLEFQVYNVPSCTTATDPNERYTVLSPSTVKDNASGLVWQRAQYTLSGSDTQFTQPLATTYCANMNMRLPAQAEALAISGANTASCAFPQAWSTWTSTFQPGNTTYAYTVSSAGTSSLAVANNYPGAALCTSGTAVAAPTITTQPAAQTVALGQTATFTVVASGTGTLSYQWAKNSVPITGATSSSYTTAATVAADNGATFSVTVSSSNGASVTSASASLTVTGSGSGGGGGADVAAIDVGSPTAVGSFVADTTCTPGAEYDPGQTITIPSAVAGVAAPEKVYESACQGASSYTIKGLVAGNSYTVVLHFAELYFPTAGSREFNVAINGTPVSGLQNFDIFAAAGNARFTAVVKSIPNIIATGGQIVISFTSGAADQPMINGIEVQGSGAASPPAPTAVTMDAGSPAPVGSYVADTTCASGAEYDPGQTVAIPAALASTAAPEKVYESACQGAVTYSFSGFTNNSVHTVVLHFAELYFPTAGSREFNVAINGTAIAGLQNFDVFAAAGNARFTAVVKSIPNITAANGQIVVSFTNGAKDQPMINGISIQ